MVAGALALLLLLTGKLLLGAGAPRAASTEPFAAPAAGPPPPPPRLVVDVVGAVRSPGLYRLPQGSRIADAVARAGGTVRSAELDLVNLAAPVVDGEQVVVPRKIPGAVSGTAPAGGSAVQSGPISLSTATLEQLDALPGVGPVTAQKILDFRAEHGAFHSIEELDAISGIGPARLDQLKGLVVP